MQTLSKGQSGRLLIIEDNPDHWAIIQTILKQQLPNLRIVWMAEPQATIDYLKECVTQQQTLPALILLDLYLPKRESGLTLLRHLKQAGTDYSLIPVVALSVSNDVLDIDDMYQAGCASYLVKPITVSEWQELIQRLKNYWWDTVTRPHLS